MLQVVVFPADESEGQRRKRRRQPRQLVLPGEVEMEQHLRDPARRQRRGGSSQPRERQVQASRSSESLDQQLPEAYRPPPPPPRAPNGRPPVTMQRPSQRNLKVRFFKPFAEEGASACPQLPLAIAQCARGCG